MLNIVHKACTIKIRLYICFTNKGKQFKTYQMRTIIKDELTNEFYCVEMNEIDANGNKYAGENDFPFWSDNIDEACDFGSELLAKNEMQMNDLTCEGTRKPVIVNA